MASSTSQDRYPSSVSAILVVNDGEAPNSVVFARLADALASSFADSEQIIVANGVGDETAHGLIELCDQSCDTTVLFLAQRLDSDVARLIGIENALGDWVLTATPTPTEIGAIPALMQAIQPGTEIIVGVGARATDQRVSYSFAKRAFYSLYGKLTDIHPEASPPRLRLYSRAAALHLVSSFEGEMLLKSRIVPGGYPTRTIHLDYDTDPVSDRRPFKEAASKGLRVLIASSTLPLRLVTAISILTAMFALAYSAYALMVFFALDSVQRGWTTLSLEISGMMFLFSIIFAFISEYILQLHAATSPRRRYNVAREVKSSRSRESQRLNVVDRKGLHHRTPAPAGAEAPAEMPDS